MRYEIKPIAVAAKPIGISERPADGAPHLLGQRKQAAAGVIHFDEIEHHEVGAGVRERLGEKAVVGCGAGTPRAAMDKDRNRARWLRAPACGCGIDVEAFDRRRSIGKAFGLADPRPHCRAVGDPALRQLIAVRRPDQLIVGVVERALVHIAPDQRALGPCCRNTGWVHLVCPSSASPNTICSCAKPATANRPSGCKPSYPQWSTKSCEARTVRPRRPASFSSHAAKFTAGPIQVKSRRLPLPILPNNTSPTWSANPKRSDGPSSATCRAAILSRAVLPASSAAAQIAGKSLSAPIGKIANRPSPIYLSTSPPCS